MFACLFALILFTLTLAVPLSAAPTEEDETVDGITYRTINVPFPGAAFTVVTGIVDRLVVGAYRDAFQNLHGWQRPGSGAFHPLLHVVPQDASQTGVAGWWRAPAVTPAGGLFTWGFVLRQGNFETLTGPSVGPGQPRPTLVEPIAINDDGLVCGSWRHPVDGKFRGFLYKPATRDYTVIEVAGALSTTCVHVTQDGRLLVRSVAAGGLKTHWVWDEGSLTPLSVPDLPPDVDLVAFHDALIAGNVGEGAFVYDGTTVHEIEAPSSTLTEIHGLQVQDGRLRVYGRYIGHDGVHNGFVATLDLEAERKPRRRGRRSGQMQRPLRPEHCWEGGKRTGCPER